MKKALSIIAVLALVAVLGVALVACVPSDPDKAEANLEEAGYVVIRADSDDLIAGAVLKQIDAVTSITATNGDEGVTILYFEDTDAAKAYYEELKADFEKAEEDKEDYKIGKSGKVVYAGTEAGVKAAG